MDAAGVVDRVKELLKGHNNLLKGFNFFLPMGYEITIEKNQPPPKKMAGFLEPKERDKHVYWSFVDVLLRYQREQRDIIKLYMEVDAPFSKDYPDLFDDFKRYLPPTFL
ncbi:hypothetical protein Gotur_008580 [Gossypium turneri]